MKYSYEYKKQCVELYRQGKWPETPVGEKQKNPQFRKISLSFFGDLHYDSKSRINDIGGIHMISNQVLQSTIDGLKNITRVDFCVADTEGKALAATFNCGTEY